MIFRGYSISIEQKEMRIFLKSNELFSLRNRENYEKS
jgi:hypothetical protein